MPLRRVMLVAVALLSGCANYHAVSEFGTETSTMTTVVKTEFDQLETLCESQAELAIVVNNISGDGPIEACQRSKRAQGQLAALTVVVLDGYAQALTALADDKPFDLSPDTRTVGAKLRGLADSAGTPMIDANAASALTSVADVLVNALASGRRDEAVRRMVAATPDLRVVGVTLRSFFVAPDTVAKAPYGNLVNVIAGSGSATQGVLENPQMRRAEPIRTAELLRALRARQKLLAKRSATDADAVPVKIAAAIDAWLAALDRFSTDALKPDSHEWVDRLKTLRNATRVAKDAVANN